jgi:hypothetical protein
VECCCSDRKHCVAPCFKAGTPYRLQAANLTGCTTAVGMCPIHLYDAKIDEQIGQ